MSDVEVIEYLQEMLFASDAAHREALLRKSEVSVIARRVVELLGPQSYALLRFERNSKIPLT